MPLISNVVYRSRYVILYGVSLAVLVFLLKWLQWKFLIADHSVEIYIGLIALFFTALGVWIATQLTKPRIQKVVVEKDVMLPPSENFSVNEAALQNLNLSSREYEVLCLLAQGHANAAIADQLCLSLSTVKTHVSNLFVKMDVKSRTQALEKAKRLKIVL